MGLDKFPFGACVKFGWQKTKENFWRLIAVVLVWVVISVMFNYTGKYFAKIMPFTAFVIRIFSAAFSMIATLGITKIGLKVYAGEKFDLVDLFGSYRLTFRYLLASILYGLTIIAGLILFIVPGIILIIRMGFYTYLIVDKGMGPMDSLKESMRLTKGNAWNLFLLWFVLLGVVLLGLLALVVGIFVAYPVTLLAHIFIYRYLEQKNPAVAV